MGAGGDARPVAREGLIKRRSSVKSLADVKDDLVVLKSIWFTKAKGDDHASRLENFYGPQAHACALIRTWHRLFVVMLADGATPCRAHYQPCTDDKFRSSFLWGRRPMLAACAARLGHLKGMTWVDLGGGTGVRWGNLLGFFLRCCSGWHLERVLCLG